MNKQQLIERFEREADAWLNDGNLDRALALRQASGIVHNSHLPIIDWRPVSENPQVEGQYLVLAADRLIDRAWWYGADLGFAAIAGVTHWAPITHDLLPPASE